MTEKRSWNELFAEAEAELREWRAQHKRASWTAIEEEVEARLAVVRARMVQELALESQMRDFKELTPEERPKCPVCGRALSANGWRKRKVTTEHNQVVKVGRRQGYCTRCGVSLFPPG